MTIKGSQQGEGGLHQPVDPKWLKSPKVTNQLIRTNPWSFDAHCHLPTIPPTTGCFVVAPWKERAAEARVADALKRSSGAQLQVLPAAGGGWRDLPSPKLNGWKCENDVLFF